MHWFQCKHTKLLIMYVDFFVIVIQPIYIGEKERQGMMFSTIVESKDLNTLRFNLFLSI